MPTIEGKDGQLWIDAYVKGAGKLAPVAKSIRALVMNTATSCEEYVSPWKTPAFDSNGPLCVFVLVKKLIEEAVKLNKTNPPSGKMVGMDKRRKSKEPEVK